MDNRRPRGEPGAVPAMSSTVQRANTQMSGMQGVYLVAAELSRRGFIVSPTSRSAKGADLLVTDQACRKAWSVQVKTNRKPTGFWLVGAHAAKLTADSHVYVLVNLRGEARPDFLVVAAADVAARVRVNERARSTWYAFHRADYPQQGEGWELFGDPHLSIAMDEPLGE